MAQGPPGDPEGIPPPPPRPSRVRAGWRAVTTRGRVVVLVGLGSLLLGAATGWREWVGVAAALAVLMVAAVLMSVGRSSVAVELDLARHRFVVGEGQPDAGRADPDQ